MLGNLAQFSHRRLAGRRCCGAPSDSYPGILLKEGSATFLESRLRRALVHTDRMASRSGTASSPFRGASGGRNRRTSPGSGCADRSKGPDVEDEPRFDRGEAAVENTVVNVARPLRKLLLWFGGDLGSGQALRAKGEALVDHVGSHRRA